MWFWGGIALQFGTGYTVAFLVYQIGTLDTTGSLGAGFLPSLLAVIAMILFFCVSRPKIIANLFLRLNFVQLMC